MIKELYKLVKRKKTTIASFNEYININNINIEPIKHFKNSMGESLLTYAIKYNNNINLFQYLYQEGFILEENFYNMTPIDICVSYNKSKSYQKFLILDWLVSKNIQFNPFFLLIYPREIIKWVKSKQWNININIKNSIGNTALHEICKISHHTHPLTLYTKQFTFNNNSYDGFYLLLEMGANPFIKNNLNLTPIDYCFNNSLINNLNILQHLNYQLTEREKFILTNHNLSTFFDNFYNITMVITSNNNFY